MERMMRLDPDAERVLEFFRMSGRPPVTTLTPGEAREVYRVSCQRLGPEPPAVAHVRDLIAQGPGHDIPLRFYRGKDCGGGPLPAVIFMHGGGFCIGDRVTHDTICRKLANAGRCAVISVDYRLAPEHKFPAAIEDCARAVAWIESRRPLSQSTASVSRWAGIVREETWPPSYRIWRATARCRQFVFSFCFIRALR